MLPCKWKRENRNANEEKGNEEGCEEVQQEALSWFFDPYLEGTRERPLWFWVEQAWVAAAEAAR